MTIPPKKVLNSDAGTADLVGGNDWDDLADYLNDVDKTGPAKINTDTRFRSGILKIRDSDNSNQFSIAGSNITADVTSTIPAHTTNQSFVMTDHAQTLQSKTIDLKNNTVAHRSFAVLVFKDGSTFYAREQDGTLLSSGSTPETVINAALAIPGDVYITAGDYDLSAGFSGFDIPRYTHVHLDMGCYINVPQGYASYVFRMNDVTFDCSLTGRGYISEQGTKSRNWIGVRLYSSTTAGTSFCKVEDVYFYQPGIAVQLMCNGAGAFVNSNVIQNIVVDNPRTAVDFQQITGDIDGNMFRDILIQAIPTITVNGFKNVDGHHNQFYNCFCWDFDESASEFNILSGGLETIIDGGFVGQNGSYINLGRQTVKIDARRPTIQTSPDVVKGGWWYGSAQTNADGLLNGRLSEIVAGTGASSNTADSTGTYRTFDTGATINSLMGHRTSASMLQRVNNCQFKAAIYPNNITNTRIFCGLVASASAPSSAADPLNALMGVGLWFDSAVSANWKRMHNDSSGASAVDDTSTAVVVGTLYKVEIYGMDDNRFRFIFQAPGGTSTSTDISANIPASTTNLSFWNYIENTTAAARSMRCYYEIITNEL